MNKLIAFWNLFRKGQEVADVEGWKKKQINANQLAMLLIAIAGVARAYGYDMGLSDETAAALATGLLALVNWVLTIITSKRAGVLAPRNGAPGASDAATDTANPAVPVERERSADRRVSDLDAMGVAAARGAAAGSAHYTPQPSVANPSLVPRVDGPVPKP